MSYRKDVKTRGQQWFVNNIDEILAWINEKGNGRLQATYSPSAGIQIKFLSVTAITNFKALVQTGNYDEKTRTVSYPEDHNAKGKKFWGMADNPERRIFYGDGDAMFDAVRRIGRGKEFKEIKDAFAHRREVGARMRKNREDAGPPRKSAYQIGTLLGWHNSGAFDVVQWDEVSQGYDEEDWKGVTYRDVSGNLSYQYDLPSARVEGGKKLIPTKVLAIAHVEHGEGLSLGFPGDGGTFRLIGFVEEGRDRRKALEAEKAKEAREEAKQVSLSLRSKHDADWLTVFTDLRWMPSNNTPSKYPGAGYVYFLETIEEARKFDGRLIEEGDHYLIPIVRLQFVITDGGGLKLGFPEDKGRFDRVGYVRTAPEQSAEAKALFRQAEELRSSNPRPESPQARRNFSLDEYYGSRTIETFPIAVKPDEADHMIRKYSDDSYVEWINPKSGGYIMREFGREEFEKYMPVYTAWKEVEDKAKRLESEARMKIRAAGEEARQSAERFFQKPKKAARKKR